MKQPDYIVIGSGPGGAAVTSKLLEAGKSVLMLERGDFLPKEKANRDSQAVYGDMKYRTEEKWSEPGQEDYRPWMHYYVGGNAKLYGAALYRFRKADFEELEYSDGVSPAWPLKYEDYAEYYDEAEKLYHVHGDRRTDPTEPTEEPYPLEPIPDEPVIADVKAQLAESGIKTIPLPVGVDLEKAANEGWELDLGKFDAYPDPALAKAEPEGTVRSFLKKYPDTFELKTKCYARQFVYEGRRIYGVEVEVDGETQVLKAGCYICAAGAINSAALFLRSSKDGSFANTSGLVGRNYMCHVCTTATATFDKSYDSTFAKTFGTNHWYQPDAGGVLYGSIQTQGKWDAVQYGLEDWTHDEGDDLEERAAKGGEFFFMTEDVPLEGNRVEVTGDGGISITREVTNLREHKALIEAFREALAGGDVLELQDFRQQLLPTAWCTHQCGTLVYGTDPQTSVLDTYCKSHDFDNLWVTDASFFPSSSALNPTLTIVANALRVGEHLARTA